jgi:hypothetical protein
MLEERIGGAVGSEEKTLVGVLVEEVKKGDGGMELWVGGKNVARGFAGNGIEHVGDVKEEQGAFGTVLEVAGC